MRAYSVAITSLAIDAPVKWTDNVLSQHPVNDVIAASRGVARRIPYGVLVRLALTRELHVTLGMTVRGSLALADELLSAGEGAVHRQGHVRVVCDRAALEQALDHRLREALESAPSPRRGRPPHRRSDGGRK